MARVSTRAHHTAHTRPEHQWPQQVDELLAGVSTVRGTTVVMGGPGSGKTTLLEDLTLGAIRSGINPDSIVFLTPSKAAASRSLAAITAELAHDENLTVVYTENFVRSVHSYAFALCRAAAMAAGTPAPRLLTGAEHDAAIREILSAHAEQEESEGYWPSRFRPALTTVGFARQLRDLLLRAAERGLSPEKLVLLGQEYQQDAWVAAGHFAREFSQITSLRGAQSIPVADVIGHAMEFVRTSDAPSPELLIVDDAQAFDPASAELIDAIRARARLTIITHDPSQAVFRFRGATTEWGDTLAAQNSHIWLHGTRRMSTHLALPATGIANSTGQHSATQWAADVVATPDEPAQASATGGAGLQILSSHTAEVAAVVDRIRRAHLIDGVPWNQIALITRTQAVGAMFRRGLLAAGVPVATGTDDIILSEQPMVRSLLDVITSVTAEALEDADLERVLLGPIGGADPITLRRILRALRRAHIKVDLEDPAAASEITQMVSPDGLFQAADALRFIVQGGELEPLWEFLTPRETELVTHVRGVVMAAQDAVARRLSVEEVLWEVWSATGVAERLAEISLRGGAQGSVADGHLDAVMSLFDLAGDFAERHPHAGIETFIEVVREQQLPTTVRDRRGPHRDCVAILPAHSAVGRQWDTVVVAGLESDIWPASLGAGTLFRQDELLDLVDSGVTPGQAGARAGRLAEQLSQERRLLLVALTRATRSLLITCVGPIEPESGDPDDDTRSPFIEELCVELLPAQQEDLPVVAHTEVPFAQWGIPRQLSASAVIAELRRAAAGQDPALAEAAAAQLARLKEVVEEISATDPTAVAGLEPADPSTWWGLRRPSSTQGVTPPGQTITLSPSAVERMMECPLRAVGESLLSAPETTSQMSRGTVIHEVAKAVSDGVSQDDISVFLAHVWPAVAGEYPFRHAQEKEELGAMAQAVTDWVTEHGVEAMTDYGEITEVRTEEPMQVEVGSFGFNDAEYSVQLRGRLDRLHVVRGVDNQITELQIIDFKTGSPITADEARSNPQMMAYQLLARSHLRGVDGDHPVRTPATLVYVKTGAERVQPSLDYDQVDEYLEELQAVALRRVTGTVPAVLNAHCGFCPLQSICPAMHEQSTLTYGFAPEDN